MKRIAALLLLTLATAVAPSVAQTPSDLDLAKLAVTAHSTGNLLLEQILLRRLMMESSGDLADAARHRLAENGLARGDYGAVRGFYHPRGIDPEISANHSLWSRYDVDGGPSPSPWDCGPGPGWERRRIGRDQG